MNTKWKDFVMKLLTAICFLGEALYARQWYIAMQKFTFVHYDDLGMMKFKLFPIQDGLEILFRGLLVMSLVWLLLALNTAIDWRKYVRMVEQWEARKRGIDPKE